MGKVLTWVVIGLLVWAVWRFVQVSRRRSARSRDAASAATGAGASDGERGPDRVAAPEAMVRCAVCGLHLPGSEARWAGGRTYCSDAHRDEGAAARARAAERDEP